MLIITSLEGLTKGVDQYVMQPALVIHRCWMMTFAWNMALDKSPLCNQDGGGDWEGEDQECFALSFPMCIGLKRMPNAFKKVDNRQKEEQCVLKDN